MSCQCLRWLRSTRAPKAGWTADPAVSCRHLGLQRAEQGEEHRPAQRAKVELGLACSRGKRIGTEEGARHVSIVPLRGCVPVGWGELFLRLAQRESFGVASSRVE